MVRAYTGKVRNDIQILCGDHQLNVIEGAYDVGIPTRDESRVKTLQEEWKLQTLG